MFLGSFPLRQFCFARVSVRLCRFGCVDVVASAGIVVGGGEGFR